MVRKMMLIALLHTPLKVNTSNNFFLPQFIRFGVDFFNFELTHPALQTPTDNDRSDRFL